MIADGTQLIGVLLILAGAVGYLTLHYRRVIKGDGGGCGCGCGVSAKRPPSQSAPTSPAPAGTQQFLPAENLADLAARHRQERDAGGAPAAQNNESPPP
ncbi:MAG: hypothetical protein HY718_16340 [Planctomycetes bacterium]|nr:hypothetical protein [Planctomycetota bacterium]